MKNDFQIWNAYGLAYVSREKISVSITAVTADGRMINRTVTHADEGVGNVRQEVILSFGVLISDGQPPRVSSHLFGEGDGQAIFLDRKVQNVLKEAIKMVTS